MTSLYRIDTEDANQAAIDSCPVDCIHWVDKDKLPALEYVMQVKQWKTWTRDASGKV